MNNLNQHTDFSLYIHWPFCKSKCPYCDFNSHVRDGINQQEWLDLYKKEIDYFAAQTDYKKANSIFFGGGTPSLMNPEIVEGIISHAGDIWDIHDAEITLEANPTSIEAKKFADFKKAGVNRASIGVQALNDNDLKALGREHSAKEALEALDVARNIFNNFSFDLIYARQGQNLESWESELARALELSANHLSLYQLTIEKGTPFYSLYKSGELKMPSEELAADMYELTEKIMQENGFSSYEVSNYAKPKFESRHNLNYWNYGDYVGIGAGAHGRVNIDGKKIATMMIHNPENWQKSVLDKGCGLQSQEEVGKEDMLSEAILMGLRLKDGIKKDRFLKTFNKIPEDLLNKDKLETFVNEGLLYTDDDCLKVTKQGRMLLNSITTALVT